MLHKTVSLLCVMIASSAFLLTGCAQEKFTSTVFNPLNLKLPFLPYQEPVRVGVVYRPRGILDPGRWSLDEMGTPWNPLRRRLESALNKPVQFETFKPFQIAAHLQSGRLDFALLDAEDYLAQKEEFGDLGKVLAISEVYARQGLIVARANSKIESLADIRGKRFAFGPRKDPVLDVGAKEALVAAGVPLKEIPRELLPVPNAMQHHISSREVAFEVVWGLGTDAGVIEKAEYDRYPSTGGSLLLRTFSKSNFRVLGETEPVRVDTLPEGPLLASHEADPKLVAQVEAFFLSAGRRHRNVLTAMGLAGFHAAPHDLGGELDRLVSANREREETEQPENK